MSQYRMMVVEDDPDTQIILKKVLESEYEVITAENGLDALGKLERVEPDIILTDIMMPIMNGWDFVERLRRIPQFKQTTVIFLSALGQRQEIKAGYDSGANLFLTKPIDPERLMRMISMVTQERDQPPGRKIYSFEQLTAILSAPSAPPEPCAATDASTAAEVQYLPPRILLVDDDRDLIRLLDLTLKQEYEIVTAEDGLVAMDQALKWKPDIFVIDWMMPKVSGPQIVDILHRTHDFKDAPIIFISARSNRKDRILVERLGVFEFLAKPFKPEELVDVIKRAIADPNFRVRIERPRLEEFNRRNKGDKSGKGSTKKTSSENDEQGIDWKG